MTVGIHPTTRRAPFAICSGVGSCRLRNKHQSAGWRWQHCPVSPLQRLLQLPVCGACRGSVFMTPFPCVNCASTEPYTKGQIVCRGMVHDTGRGICIFFIPTKQKQGRSKCHCFHFLFLFPAWFSWFPWSKGDDTRPLLKSLVSLMKMSPELSCGLSPSTVVVESTPWCFSKKPRYVH